MFVESGALVAVGLLLMFLKCSWSVRMKMLSRPLIMDAIIFVVLTAIHWGTFTGVMAATVGALICSALISVGRFFFGHITKNIYTPGMFNVALKIGIKH